MRLAAALMACLMPFESGGATAATVSIVLSDTGVAYQEAAQAVSHELAGRTGVTVSSVEELERSPPQQASVVIALGTRAFRAVLATGTRTPVIATLIPRAAYELELKNSSRPNASTATTAVFLDQPIARQLNLVRVVLPKKTQVGVLVSAATEDTLRRFEPAARERGLALVRETVPDAQRISAALSRLLGESELLLALPDPLIYNAGTIHNILLSALRAQQPLIGFSEAYVRAGAFAAVYSRPHQVGRQAGEIAARAIAGASLPPPQYPRAFSVSVNPTVARTLGLALEPEDAIAARLQRMEREP